MGIRESVKKCPSVGLGGGKRLVLDVDEADIALAAF